MCPQALKQGKNDCGTESDDQPVTGQQVPERWFKEA